MSVGSLEGVVEMAFKVNGKSLTVGFKSINEPTLGAEAQRDEVVVTIPPPERKRCSLCNFFLWFLFKFVQSVPKPDSTDMARVPRTALVFFDTVVFVSISLVLSLLFDTTTAEFGPRIEM